MGIAQAIVHRPALVLLDEPTVGLDPVQIAHMRALIHSLRGRHTILVSSHLLGEIHALCDRIFVLHAGKIAAIGTEAELANQVGQATRVRLEVRGSAAELARALASVPEVVRHTIDAEKAGVLKVTVVLRQDAREALATALVAAGLGLLRLERVHLALESIFMRLTCPPPTEEPCTPS